MPVESVPPEERAGQIARRLEDATPGPWEAEPNTHAGRVWVQRAPYGKADCEPLFNVRGAESYEQRTADATFIAHCPDDIAWLLAERDRLNEVVTDQQNFHMHEMVRLGKERLAERDALSTALATARGAMPDPDKLELLADWLDAKYAADPEPQVQNDLRVWAVRARAFLSSCPVPTPKEEEE